MKVCIFASYYFPHVGGLENYSACLADNLKKRDIKPVIVTCNTENQPVHSKKDGVAIVRLDCWHLLGKTLPLPKPNVKNRQLLKELLGNKIDIIVTETRFFPLCFWAAFLAKRKKIKQVHIEHGSAHTVSKNPMLTWLFHLYDHTFGAFVIKNAQKNIAISSRGAKLLKHLGSRSTRVVYNSLDLTKFAKTSLKKDKPTDIVYVGRMIEQKGVQDLIQAFQMLESKQNRLVLVGGGNFLPELHRLANDNPAILFTGEFKIDKVKKVLEQATVFVNPSYLEGLPTTVLEAGALGIPVIATNVGGTSDIIKNNVNGFLVEPGKPRLLAKKMSVLLKDKKLRRQFSKEISQTIINRFDWTKNIDKIIETLEQCL